MGLVRKINSPVAYLYSTEENPLMPFLKNKHFLIQVSSLATLFVLGEMLAFINTGNFLNWHLWINFFRVSWPIYLQVVAFIYLVLYSVQFFNHRFQSRPNALQRFVVEIALISTIGFVVQEIFRWMFIKFSVVPEDPVVLDKKLRQLQMVSMVFLLVIYAFVTSMRIFKYLQQKQLELLQAQRRLTQSQLEALKTQLNPHFLFNSLSILTSLVYVDADVAEKFIEKLSKTYRYLLEQKDADVVPLQKELEFLDAYLFLIEHRFGKKLVVKRDVNGMANHYLLSPMSVMVAMEYIISSNAMSAGNPLVIEVKVQDECLVMQYNHQPKAKIEDNSSRQLEGLQNKYALLPGNRPMQVITGEGVGVIKYPLLKA